MTDPRRNSPSVGAILAEPRVADASSRLGANFIKSAVKGALQQCRDGLIAPAEVVDVVLATLPGAPSHLQPVINATGIIVHTNLGRAPLSAGAQAALLAAAGTTNLEFDVATGRRSRRGPGTVDALLRAVPSSDDALVVNNGAAALMLTTNALAAGREVLLSRGEMVEIGDGFRIPELIESSGARIREVGTTNRTSLNDYVDAINDSTAFVLKIHPSNFAVRGFTSDVSIRQLTSATTLPVVADIGSGLLTHCDRLPDEPDATTALADGAALVTASGDKLLGGPQCGLLFGRADLIHTLRRHPLARAVRVDKLTLAALEATLDGPPPPVSRYLATPREELRDRAQRIIDSVDAAPFDISPTQTAAAVGGGGAPLARLDSAGISLPEELAPMLRAGHPPIVGRITQGRLILDLIAVDPEDDHVVGEALAGIARLTPSEAP